jgi:hypothetical protein
VKARRLRVPDLSLGPLVYLDIGPKSWPAAGGVWGGTYTDPACTSGIPTTPYRTTETAISVDGSAWQGWFTSEADSMARSTLLTRRGQGEVALSRAREMSG